MVDVHFEDCAAFQVDDSRLEQWFRHTIQQEGFGMGEITLVFCSDEYLLEMNRTHLNHDYYTDIITFDYTEEKSVSGDLFISVDRVFDNASEFNVSRETELKRVCIHGVLHLCGYKDKSDSDIKLMRTKEEQYLDVSRETLFAF